MLCFITCSCLHFLDLLIFVCTRLLWALQRRRVSLAFVCYRAQAVGAVASVVAMHGLSSCDLQTLELAGSSSCEYGLSSPWHVESFQAQEWEPSPHIGAGGLFTTIPPEKSITRSFKELKQSNTLRISFYANQP